MDQDSRSAIEEGENANGTGGQNVEAIEGAHKPCEDDNKRILEDKDLLGKGGGSTAKVEDSCSRGEDGVTISFSSSPRGTQQLQDAQTSVMEDSVKCPPGEQDRPATTIGKTGPVTEPPFADVVEASIPPLVPCPSMPDWPPNCDPNYRMPNELQVAVAVDGEVRDIFIKVERFEGVKPFHGGYRNKRTGRIFHHASTQFGQRQQPVKETSHLRTRDTQTFQTKSRTIQTTNECGTQMARRDMHLDSSGDTFKSVGSYQTATEFWRLRAQKTVQIQRFWRGFMARSLVWSLQRKQSTQYAKELALTQEAERRRQRQRQQEMRRRIQPTTLRDFEILYTELNQWREAETRRIKDTESGEQRQLSLRDLLQEETRLLQTIERLKTNALQEGKERRTKRTLELMSTPKRWQMRDGKIAEITTPWTARAKELQELYHVLDAPVINMEERLDILLRLKWTVGEYDCRLTRDIAELVDREADLLSRGRGEASLRPLRQRTRNLFLTFTETPAFNLEAKRFLLAPPINDESNENWEGKDTKVLR